MAFNEDAEEEGEGERGVENVAEAVEEVSLPTNAARENTLG